MTDAVALPLSHQKRSGTETRKRSEGVHFRLTKAEKNTLEETAAANGLTLGSYVRETLLKKKRETRSRRVALADVAVLHKLLAEMGRIGGNMNQIARAVNTGANPNGAVLSKELAKELAELRELRILARGLLESSR